MSTVIEYFVLLVALFRRQSMRMIGRYKAGPEMLEKGLFSVKTADIPFLE